MGCGNSTAVPAQQPQAAKVRNEQHKQLAAALLSRCMFTHLCVLFGHDAQKYAANDEAPQQQQRQAPAAAASNGKSGHDDMSAIVPSAGTGAGTGAAGNSHLPFFTSRIILGAP